MSSAVLQAKPGAAAREARALQKGQQTKAAIVDAALVLATRVGLEGLSVGSVADKAGMSKSGVFSHFGSREELQISVVRAYHARFRAEVFEPALAEPRGLPRLRALFGRWMTRMSVEIASGCLFVGGAVEFDDRPGPVRDALVASVKDWLGALQRAVVQARDEGHLASGIAPAQVAFEIHGLILALHYEARFLQAPGSVARAEAGFENILKLYGAARASAIPARAIRKAAPFPKETPHA